MIRVEAGPGFLSIRGHAGTAPRGRDLACCAVSAAGGMLAAAVTEWEARGLCSLGELLLEPGKEEISFSGASREVEFAWESMVGAFLALCRELPEGVEVPGCGPNIPLDGGAEELRPAGRKDPSARCACSG